MAKWEIWIKGVNYNELNIELSNELALVDLPEALQTVNSDNWTQVAILGLPESPIPANEPLQGAGNIQVNVPGRILEYKFTTEPYRFELDYEAMSNLMKQFNRQYVLLCLDGFEQSEATKYPVRYHSEGNCLLLSYNEAIINHKFEEGVKDVEISLRKVFPEYD